MDTGFRKRSCANKELKRDDDSSSNHRALEARRGPPAPARLFAAARPQAEQIGLRARRQEAALRDRKSKPLFAGPPARVGAFGHGGPPMTTNLVLAARFEQRPSSAARQERTASKTKGEAERRTAHLGSAPPRQARRLFAWLRGARPKKERARSPFGAPTAALARFSGLAQLRARASWDLDM